MAAPQFSNYSAPAPQKRGKSKNQKYSLLNFGFQPSDVPRILFHPKTETETRFDVALLCSAETANGLSCSNRVYLSYGITKMGHGSIFGLSDLKGVAQEQAELKVCETETYVDVSVRHLDGVPMFIIKNTEQQTCFQLEKNKDYLLGHGDVIMIGHHTFFVEIVKSQKATIQETFQLNHFKAFAQHAQIGAISSTLHIKGPKPQPFGEAKSKSSKKKATESVQKAPKKMKKDVPVVPLSVAPSSVDNSPLQLPNSTPEIQACTIVSAPGDFQIAQISFEDYTSSPSTNSPLSDELCDRDSMGFDTTWGEEVLLDAGLWGINSSL